MGEVSMSSTHSTGLLPSIASLLNNRLFSDVEFVFISDTREMQRIYCHKLILSIRSKVFASMFFDKKESSCEVRLPSSKASSFVQFLRFLYTDDVQFQTFEEAQKLYELADEYVVEELIEKCSNYILHESLTIENVFLKYECALSKNMYRLLKDCHHFVCSNTQLVLESVHLTHAPVEVVEDIVKLDNLSVSTEFEVICAILKWGSEELKRKKLSSDEKYLRKCINPLVKHIRFLTLSSQEFEYFIENFDIFSGYESSLLTRKIYNSQSDVHLPESLCPIDVRRTGKCDSKSVSSVSPHKNTSPNLSVNCSLNPPSGKEPSPLIQNSATSDSLKSAQSVFFQNNTSHDSPFDKASSSFFTNNLSPHSPSKSVSNFSYISKSMIHISDSKTEISNAPESPTSETNKISYEIKKLSPFNETNKSETSLNQKFCSSPSIRDMTYFPRYDNSHLRDFEFPLLESLPCFRTSFENDVKSTVTFKMKTGNIRLYGFELKVKDSISKAFEELDVDVDLCGFSKQPFNKLFKEKFKKNFLSIKFPDCMILQAGHKGQLEVSIDNLLLNRCCTCNNNKKEYELNSGLNFACEITLNSTQKTENGFLFLISKLIYMPC